MARTYVHETPEILTAKPKAEVATGRNWGVALPLGLVAAFLIIFGVIGLLNAEVIGSIGTQVAEIGLPYVP